MTGLTFYLSFSDNNARMPVRKIPKNYRSVTGIIASEVNAKQNTFESTLERDYMLLLDFDPDVLSFEEQPVRINYHSPEGKSRHYTPDILVTYRGIPLSSSSKPPLLVEIKYRKDLFEQWKKLKPKFRAARIYAKEHGWFFRIITEVEIRTPYLKNVKFLRQFQRYPINQNQVNLLLEKISELGLTDPESLLSSLCLEVSERIRLLPTLWQLVAQRAIVADLDLPLTMQSPIWFASAVINEE